MNARSRVAATLGAVIATALLLWLLLPERGAAPRSADRTSEDVGSEPQASVPRPRLAVGPVVPKKGDEDGSAKPPLPPPDRPPAKEEAKAEAGTRRLVVDADGKPVPNLDLAWIREPWPGWIERDSGWQKFVVGGEGRSDAGRLVPVDPSPSALLASDESGAVWTGMEPWPGCVIESRNPRWRVRRSSGSSKEDGPIVVVPAVSRRVRFVSDDERVPLPQEFGVSVSGPGEGSRFTIRSPILVLSIDAERVADRPIAFTVTVEPLGFMPEKRIVEVTNEEVQTDVEVRLRPVEKRDNATVEFLLASTDLEFLKRPFDIEVRDVQKRDLSVARTSVESLGDGRLRATVPPGTWFLRLRPADGWCNPVYWEGIQTLPEGRTTTVTWTVPPHGSAVLHVSNGFKIQGGKLLVLAPASDGMSSGNSLEEAMSEKGTHVQALSLGSWTLKVYADEHHTLSEKTFDVKSGESIEVTLDK